MIGSFELIDLAILAFLWFFMSAFSNLIWMRIVTLRYVGKALMNWIDGLDNDKEGQEVLSKLFLFMFAWAGQAQIKTGKKIKVKDPESGEVSETDEVLTPVDLLGQRIASLAIRKLNSGMGGTKAALRRILEEEASSMGGGLSPAALSALYKGKVGPALTEIALPHLQKRLNKPQDNTKDGGWNE